MDFANSLNFVAKYFHEIFLRFVILDEILSLAEVYLRLSTERVFAYSLK